MYSLICLESWYTFRFFKIIRRNIMPKDGDHIDLQAPPFLLDVVAQHG